MKMNLYRTIQRLIHHLLVIFGEISISIKNWYSNEKIGFDAEVKLITIPMTIIGVWPFASHNRLPFTITSALCIIACFNGTKSFFIEWKNEGIYQCLFELFFIFTTIKIFMFRFRENKLGYIFHWMKKNWELGKYLMDNNKDIMYDYSQKSRYIVGIWMMTVCLVFMGALTLPWITSIIREKPLELYVDVWYPVLITESPILELAMTLQIIVALYTLLAFFSLESCFFIIALHCCGQLKILSNTIAKFNVPILHDYSSGQYHCSYINCIVKRHWRIIKFYEALRRYFVPLLCLNLIAGRIYGNTAVIMIYKSTRTPDGIIFSSISSIYFSMVMILGFMYCHVGEMLIQESLNISNAVFNCQWYNFKKREIKSCLIIMTYSQNTPMVLNFGLFCTLSNELIKGCMTWAYSFLNVSRSLRDKNN